MIEFVTGDIFNTSCEVIVNPVNCVGSLSSPLTSVMKNRFPGMYTSYRTACKNGDVVIGRTKFYIDRDVDTGKMRKILNMPITGKSGELTHVSYIEAGLISILGQIQMSNIKSIAFPFLGYNQGLSWKEVEQIFEKWHLDNPALDKVEIKVYLPQIRKPSPLDFGG